MLQNSQKSDEDANSIHIMKFAQTFLIRVFFFFDEQTFLTSLIIQILVTLKIPMQNVKKKLRNGRNHIVKFAQTF